MNLKRKLHDRFWFMQQGPLALGAGAGAGGLTSALVATLISSLKTGCRLLSGLVAGDTSGALPWCFIGSAPAVSATSGGADSKPSGSLSLTRAGCA